MTVTRRRAVTAPSVAVTAVDPTDDGAEAIPLPPAAFETVATLGSGRPRSLARSVDQRESEYLHVRPELQAGAVGINGVPGVIEMAKSVR